MQTDFYFTLGNGFSIRIARLAALPHAKIQGMSQGITYRPDIDGLRAIAVLAVMFYHLQSNWLPGGFIGVDIFFVISGFVVSASITKLDSRNFWSFSAQFYARRLARIVPALVLVLCVSSLAATLLIPRAWLSELSNETALYAFWGLSNWRLQTNTDLYFAPRAELNPFTQTWSLGVEEQFYLIAPILFYLWVRGQHLQDSRMQRGALLILGIFGVVSLLACAWLTASQPTIAFYSIVTRFWELALGALLFLWSTQLYSVGHRSARTAMISKILPWLGFVLIGLACLASQPAHFPWPWALLACVGTLCILGGADVNTMHPLRKALALPPWVWIGRRSYSLYLWHWPVFVLMRWTVGLESALQLGFALGLTVVLAMASYRFVEQPIRHHRLVQQGSRAAVIFSLLVVVFISFIGTLALFTNHARVSLSQVSRHANDWHPGSLRSLATHEPNCTMTQDIEPFHGGTQRIIQAKACQRTPTTQTIYLLGDSHAGALIPLFEELGAQFGFTIRVFSFQGKIATPYACSYLDLQAPMHVGRAPGCLPFNEAVRDYVNTHAKASDLIVLASLRMPRYGDQWASFGIRDMVATINTPIAKDLRLQAAAEIKVWLEPLLDSGAHAIFMAPSPVFQAPVFRCADWFNANNPICVGQNRQPRADLEALRKPILQAMEGPVQQHPRVLIWDPMPTLCNEKNCEALLNGRPLFFDGDHLSNYGNFILYPHFLEWLRQNRLLQPNG